MNLLVIFLEASLFRFRLTLPRRTNNVQKCFKNPFLGPLSRQLLFSWLVRQPYFKELTDSDIRARFLKDKEDMIEADLLPFGFKYDAVDDNNKDVADPYSLYTHLNSNW